MSEDNYANEYTGYKGRTAFEWAKACEAAEAEIERLREAFWEKEHNMQQLLGKALGYPNLQDSQGSIPWITKESYVIGPNTAFSLIDEIIAKFTEAQTKARLWEKVKKKFELVPIGTWRHQFRWEFRSEIPAEENDTLEQAVERLEDV